MTTYHLPNGKVVHTEKDIPADQMDDFIASMMGEQESPTSQPTPSVAAPQDDSFLMKAWKGATDPLVDIRSATPEVKKATDMFAQEHPMIGVPMNFATDVLSSLTSPLNLATTGAFAGAGAADAVGLPSIARGLQMGGKVLSAPTAAEGAYNTFRPSATMPERVSGATEMLGGISGMRSKLPAIAESIKSPSTSMPKDLDIGPAPPDSVRPMFNPEGQRGMTGSAQVKGMPEVIYLKKTTPEVLKRAKEMGYEFVEQTSDGKFKMRKTGTGGPQPILEGEVGQNRARIGSLADEKKGSMAAEILNFPRAIMASMDFSAPLRQGLPLIHKKEFWSSLDDMFKAWGSEEAFRAIQNSIADKPLFKERVGPKGKMLPSFAEDAGLKLTDLTNLSNREEALMSTWAEKIPGVRRSNRAYTAFLNKLRADSFESLVKSGKVFGADGEVNAPLAKELANFVNTASGRGSLGKLEQSAVALNSTFFAPRLIASRLQMFNPWAFYKASPMVRKETLKSLFAIAAAGNLVTQLGSMAGGEVESDPTSSDFGKLKFGNTRLDPYAGFQQYLVLANRLIQGRIKSSTTGNEYNLGEKFGRATRFDVATRFAESKLNPVMSFITGWLHGKDPVTGQPFDVPEEMVQRLTPIMLQDLKQLATENPDLIPFVHDDNPYEEFHPENLPFAVLAAFGMGVQNYESR